MAAQGGAKSKWGSFLSQAVANVESRLDTMLAEEEQQAAKQNASSTPPAQPPKPSTGRFRIYTT